MAPQTPQVSPFPAPPHTLGMLFIGKLHVTGDVLDAEKRRFLASTDAPVLLKPFDFGAVRNLVRRRLADAGASGA